MESCLGTVELGLYTCSLVSGIITAASVKISQGNLGGLCMLYGSVGYNVTAGGTIGVLDSSPRHLCDFVSSVSGVVSVVSSFLLLFWLLCCCCADGGPRAERVCVCLMLCVCGVFLLFLLMTGCVLTIGRDQLCDSITHTVPNITRCDEAQSKVWASPYNGATFYSSLYTAETAVWVNFFSWLIIGVLGTLTLQWGQRSGNTARRGPNGGSERTLLRREQRGRARIRSMV